MRGNVAALKAATQTRFQWLFKAVLIGPYIRNMVGCDYKHNDDILLLLLFHYCYDV